VEVVLDSSILVSDFGMTSGSFEVVLNEARNGRIRLVVPEIVILETVNKFRERMEDIRSEIEQQETQLRRLLGAIEPILAPLPSTAAAVEAYESRLRAKLSQVAALTPSIPNIPHELVVDRALARRKPFARSGTGYRDSLLWATVLERASRDSVALLTSNWKDFAASKEGVDLHDDLLSDVQEAELPWDRVTLYPDLRSFVAKNIEAVRKVANQVRSSLSADEKFREEFESRLRAAVASLLRPGDDVETPLEDVENAMVQSIETASVRDVEVHDAYLLSRGNVLLEVTAVVEATVEGFVHKSDAYTIEEQGWEIWDADWNEHYALVAKEAALSLNLQVNYSPVNRTVVDIDLWSFELSETL
jgi:hypothetical protein